MTPETAMRKARAAARPFRRAVQQRDADAAFSRYADLDMAVRLARSTTDILVPRPLRPDTHRALDVLIMEARRDLIRMFVTEH